MALTYTAADGDAGLSPANQHAAHERVLLTHGQLERERGRR